MAGLTSGSTRPGLDVLVGDDWSTSVRVPCAKAPR